jgi:predicted ATPase/signal transduction histidine kinase
MGEGTVLPDRDSTGRAEMVHESEHARVTRLVVAGRTVVRKEVRGSGAAGRCRHETAMLQRLRGVVGVAQLADAPQDPCAIMLEDAGDKSLAQLKKPLAVDDLIELGVRSATAVAGMHRRGVMHRDINPANIVMSANGTPCLVDFALATSLGEIRPDFTHHTQILGTLAYLAPEQTGRTGRPVDQRADLYALGATLYELATGRPVFGSADPLRLTHDHLARVPAAPAELNSAIPAALSAVIMHLLEKEPDNRYQTADGVIYDLEQLRDPGGRITRALRVGVRDFPLRLLPPSRLVGRDTEVALLQAALDDARTGRCRGVLVSGAPGVGKTALVDQLRAVVTARDGWFVAGKFDPYRRDLEFDGFYQAFRALGRLLLAEPEDELATLRDRMLAALGPNAALASAVTPEFAALLGVPPEPGDPLTAQVRARRTAVELLRAVASPKRPVVLFVDDLQWAGRYAVSVVDWLLSEEHIEGLLLVGAYRHDDVNAAHPLAAPLSRWRGQVEVRHLRLNNLAGPSLVTLVAEMLRVDQTAAAGLAAIIDSHTHGNPYDTVELLNTLRREGVLTPTAAGWDWDEAIVGSDLSRSEIAALPTIRFQELPPSSRQLIEAMACLGGRAELGVLQVATNAPADVVDQRLAPALEEGLLVAEPGMPEAVRFAHDRTQQVILDRLDRHRRSGLHLTMARRLAAVPELFAAAAEQYLAVVGAVEDAAERQQVVALLQRAAEQAKLVGDYALVNTLCTAALRVVDPSDTATLIWVHTGRHLALFCLGRLEEADEVYGTLQQLSGSPVAYADATAVQVISLTHRASFTEAIGLAVNSLRELGIAVPTIDELPAAIDRHVDYFYRWLEHMEAADGLTRPDIADPALLAVTRLIDAAMPAAFLAGDHASLGWLNMEATRIWLEHGPASTLVGPASSAAFQVVAMRGDDSAGYRALRRILAVGEARGYEPGTSQARHVFAVLSCWFEPIENGVRADQRARAGLIAGGDLAYAGYSYQAVAALADCAPALDAVVAEVEAGLAFVRRTGSEQLGQWLETYRWWTAVLLGESSARPGETYSIETYAENSAARFFAHHTRAIAAAIFGDQAGLDQHTASAMPLLPLVVGAYPTAVARVLRGLALAGQARLTDGDERAEVLSELDAITRWLSPHAANAPDNFLHLLRLLEAERAWAVGDFRAAVVAFDAARRAAASRQRPWHRGLIAERAACFFLANGIEHTGYELLAEARRAYLAWGATAKVDQLDWAHPTLRPSSGAVAAPAGEQPGDHADRRSAITSGTIDLLGIVSASQALSSQTSIERLHARVVEVLRAMTGATAVHLVLWSDDRQDWLLPEPTSNSGTAPASADGGEYAAPLSVLRYVQRMQEPLVVADVTDDDRFGRDPYFTDIACCSLLALPILNRGVLRAVLLLENQLMRGAFTAERLDAIKLIAGQLAVSLDNAKLYAEFRQIADEQAALRRVATLVARGVKPAEVFDAVTDEMRRSTDAALAGLWRLEPSGELALQARSVADTALAAILAKWPERMRVEGDTLTALVQRTGRPARIDDYHNVAGPIAARVREVGVRAAVGVPVIVEGSLWGMATIGSVHAGPMPADTEARMSHFADLVATAIANAATRSELVASRVRIVAAADEARRRLEHDLHDGAQQRLVSLGLQLRMAEGGVPADLSAHKTQLAEIGAGLASVLDELREISRGIHPAILSQGGLRAALRTLARRSVVPVSLDLAVDGRLSDTVEVAAYFVVAEALTNVAKHADASTVDLSARVDDERLYLSVADDGIGGADVRKGSGLIGLKDRVEALGGHLEVVSPKGTGTSLHATIPLSEPPTGA